MWILLSKLKAAEHQMPHTTRITLKYHFFPFRFRPVNILMYMRIENMHQTKTSTAKTMNPQLIFPRPTARYHK